MIIPEYGRNIQKMVKHVVAIEDRDERNKAAKSIVRIMGQLNPKMKDVPEHQEKLWNHLHIIAEYQLEIDSEYPKPTVAEAQEKPRKLEYRTDKIRYKHYGKSVEALIKKAMEYPEGDEKKYLTETIANLMKRSYLAWNRDSVNDQVIIDQLGQLSDGKLQLAEDFILQATNEILANNKPRTENKRHKKGKPRSRRKY